MVAIALNHLLRNACLHTERGVITVQLNASGIAIEDNGTGGLDAVAQRPLDRLTGAHDDTSSGPGLSLSIVKRVADHLGWVIRHTSLAAGGSRYILEFEPRQAVPVARAG
ncbi:ATP-binding protein [Metapseudomonas resinovorans]|uniref:ATP-binding protein n=1 Tax=Metapseudomonas resinovorans TaxID=53412 RepID=UPI00331BD0C9